MPPPPPSNHFSRNSRFSNGVSDQDVVDLIEDAFLDGQTDGKQVDLVYLLLKTSRERLM